MVDLSGIPMQEVGGHRVIRDVRHALYALQGETEVAVDLETSGLHPRRDKIAVVSLYGDTTGAVAILHVRGVLPPEIKAFLEEPGKRLTFHNGVSFDIPYLMNNGVSFANAVVHDTLVGETVVRGNNRKNVSVSLRASVARRQGIELKKEVSHGHWMDPRLTAEQVKYCVEDILSLHGLRRAQYDIAVETQQLPALELEMAIVPTVAMMTYNGLPFDFERLDYHMGKARQEVEELEGEFTAEFGEMNFGSVVQVKNLLNAMGATLPHTRKELLKELAGVHWRDFIASSYFNYQHDDPDIQVLMGYKAHQFIQKLVKYRTADKKLNSYKESWVLEHVVDSNVHAKFWQCGTDTGRFSSSGPNLQQVDRTMRDLFGGREGWQIVARDYSQIEVVCAAWLAKDQNFMEMIRLGGDVHCVVADALFQRPPGTTVKSDRERRIAKAGSFTLLFGGGAERLVEQARSDGALITLAEAKAFSEQFFRMFPGVKRERSRAYEVSKSGRRLVSIQLPTTLRRNLINDPANKQFEITPTRILNTQVQGTAAGGMKHALLLARKAGIDIYLGATVHDELVGCVPDKWAADWSAELHRCMVEGMAKVVGIPATTEEKAGLHWKS